MLLLHWAVGTEKLRSFPRPTKLVKGPQIHTIQTTTSAFLLWVWKGSLRNDLFGLYPIHLPSFLLPSHSFSSRVIFLASFFQLSNSPTQSSPFLLSHTDSGSEIPAPSHTEAFIGRQSRILTTCCVDILPHLSPTSDFWWNINFQKPALLVMCRWYVLRIIFPLDYLVVTPINTAIPM